MDSYFDIDELHAHNTKDNGWIAFEGSVYDVTAFIGVHPGGSELLNKYIGSDVTDILRNKDYHSHSNNAFTLLKQYKIGLLTKNKKATNCEKNLGNKDEADSLIDWNKGMLKQVPLLANNYEKWVMTPVTRNIRIFDSKFLEYLTKSHWMIVLIFWIPIAINLQRYYLNILIQEQYSTLYVLSNCLIHFLIGFFVWTLLEYTIHRFIFHINLNNAHPYLIQFHFLIHGLHHKSPMDKYRLVFPPVPASIIGLLIYGLFCCIFNRRFCRGIVAGAIVGYICYDMIHYFLHHGENKKNSFLSRMRHIHNIHHYQDTTTAFGISNDFWDYVFNTQAVDDTAIN